MPSRWQIDILVYEEQFSYPVLLLQPAHRDDHRRLLGLLARAGLATPTTWEWEHGFRPLAAGCQVRLESPAVTVRVGEHGLTVGFRFTEPPQPWLAAAHRQRQVLFVLLPPSFHPAGDALIHRRREQAGAAGATPGLPDGHDPAGGPLTGAALPYCGPLVSERLNVYRDARYTCHPYSTTRPVSS